jgi:ADP-ribosylglycohydrolase
MKPKRALASILVAVTLSAPGATLQLTREDYLHRVEAMWTAQIVAVLMNWPFEHQTASTLWITNYPKPYTIAPVDDDWYYEMVAIRAFEKYGINMTAEQLGEQWKENACGSWGSSEQARLNLAKGIKAPDSGHPRYNRLWFTIGPQFSADVYGALAPGLVNEAARMARDYGHVNGYAEGTDGAVFMAAMVSLAFAETDTREIVRSAAHMIHPSSPYRQCLDLVIALAEAGKTFEEIAAAVEDRWHVEYPATNNAVSNGGLVAAALWFGGGDFFKTMNLCARAADFTDADCNAANAAAVLGALHGMKCLPPDLVKQLGDRIKGEKMGPVTLTPPVDERISDLARRAVAIGEKILLARGAKLQGSTFLIEGKTPMTQRAERFELADLMQYWNADWQLERAGFGGAGGGMAGIRGITYLDGDILATYPRDEVRGLVLRRALTLSDKPVLSFQVAADSGRAWELNVYANNKLLEKRVVDGGTEPGRKWHDMKIDLSDFASQPTHLRLYQRVLVPNRVAGNAYWRNLRVD